MTDFGRKDFGDALKKLFEADKPNPAEMDPDADEIGVGANAFQASKKAQVKGSDELDKMTGKEGLSGQLKEFAKMWNGVKKILKQQSTMAIKHLEAFAAANKDVAYQGKATTKADARAAALGDPTAIQGKFDAADAAGGRDTHTTSTGKVDKLSGADIRGTRKKRFQAPDAGVTPGAQADYDASQVSGPGTERERMKRDRAARVAAATGGK